MAILSNEERWLRLLVERDRCLRDIEQVFAWEQRRFVVRKFIRFAVRLVVFTVVLLSVAATLLLSQ